jgi:hypothetical protein
MGRGFGIVAVVSTLALAGVASHAYAQSTVKQAPQTSQAFTVDPSIWQSGPAAGGRSLQWNGNGRWGLKLDYSQPTTRDMQAKDVDVGTFYRVNKRLRIAGSVNVGDGSAPRMVTPDEKPQPRVRLETLFRF